MTTVNDIGVSVVRARDVQNPLHFGEMKVRAFPAAAVSWEGPSGLSASHFLRFIYHQR